MQNIIIWARQIFIICIISNIFIRLAPAQKYEKYIKYVCTIILLTACIVPVLEFFSGSFSFEKIYESMQFDSSIKKLKNEVNYTQSDTDNQVIDNYLSKIERDIDSFTLNKGLYPVSTEVNIVNDSESEEFGSICGINLVVSTDKTKNSQSDINRKKNKDNISIEIDKIKVEPEIVLNQEADSEQIISLKQELSQFYNISENIINISVSS